MATGERVTPRGDVGTLISDDGSRPCRPTRQQLDGLEAMSPKTG